MPIYNPVNDDDHTIRVKISDSSPTLEFYATSLLHPGTLVQFTPTGDWYVPTHVEHHAYAGESASAMFVAEDRYHGKGITDIYGTNSRVHLQIGRTGDILLRRCTTNFGFVMGEPLQSNGDGTLGGSLGANFVVANSIQVIAPLVGVHFVLCMMA